MSSKKIENIIKNSIDIEFEDITNNLIEQYIYANENKRKKMMLLRICTSLYMIIIICISVHFTDLSQKNNNLLDGNKNEIYVNEINYKTPDEYMNLEINTNQVIDKTYEELSTMFHYDLNLNKDNIVSILCKNNSFNNEIEQCEITYTYNSGIIYINVKNDSYPTFTTETVDGWEENIKQKLKISKIKDREVIIIQNLDNNKFISQYYDDEVLNFRTKIMMNDVGISFESYKIDLDTFVLCLEKII